MRLGRVFRNVLLGLAVLCAVSAMAQQIQFPNFSSVANLQLNGGSHQAVWNSASVLRLTDGYSGLGAFHPENTASWFNIQQPVDQGFTTYFKFQIHTAAICCAPADGFAFVVQNAASTDPTYGATGSGNTARGAGSGGLGYAGIRNSLAVEFDTANNAWDPSSSNHVAVQSCGTGTNGPVHIAGTFTIGTNHNVTSCLVAPTPTTGFTAGINTSIPHLGVTCTSGPCANGQTHEVVIEYTPGPQPNANGTLKVWIDPQFIPTTHTPVSTAVPAINIPYNIDHTYSSTGISLASGGSAYVGFTGSQTTIPEATDIMAWEFTPHTQSEVAQQIPPGGTPADYPFGGHDTIVTYFPGFVNDPTDPYIMTVTATPISRSLFHTTRLAGTLFDKEQCIVYLGTGGTGGNCIVYTITCQRTSNPNQNVTCPASANPCDAGNQTGCIQFSTSFYTSDPVTPTNADYLKTDPIGSNNWVSIFLSYDPNAYDGRTAGQGGTTSDFVATYNPYLSAPGGGVVKPPMLKPPSLKPQK
jgi:Bacterial lectin